MKTGPLSVRLSLWICSVLILFFLAGLALTTFFWTRNFTQGLNEHGLIMVRETAYNLDRIFLQTEMATELLAADLETDLKKKEDIAPFLKTMAATVMDQCADISTVSIVFEERMLHPDEKWNAFLCSREGDGHSVKTWTTGAVDYFHKEWFLVPMTLQKPIWTVPYLSDSQQETILLSYSAPFYMNKDGKRIIAGVIVADIPIQTFEKYFQKPSVAGSARLTNASKFFLMNQFGQIVVSPNSLDDLTDTIFSLCDEPDQPDPADWESARSMLHVPYGKIRLNKAPLLDSGASELFYASCVNKWMVGLAIPGNWLTHMLTPVFLRFLIWGILVLCVIVVIIFMVCKRLSRPLLELSRAAESLGNGDFNAPLPEFKGSVEVELMTNSFQQMRSDLTGYIAKLKETVAARERAEGELNAAKSIQRDLLPPELPPDSTYPNIYCAGELVPAHGVGGDLYDVFPVDDDHLALIVGDVSGKGVPAALFMAVAQTLQRTLVQTEKEPDVLVTRLNALLASNNSSNMFVTYWFGILNVHTGELKYTNAGHNPPILRSSTGTLEFLPDRHGPPLAIVPGKKYGMAHIQLLPGDTLLLYTDGVTEAFNENEKMFGEDGLWKTLKNFSSSEPGCIVKQVREAVEAHAGDEEQSDDITLLAVRFSKDGDAPSGRTVLKATSANLNEALAFVMESPEIQSLSSADLKSFQVCFEEVFANIASYAYGDDAPGYVEIDRFYNAANGEFRITFIDSGRPYNPLEHTDPDVTLSAEERGIGGLGIYIVKQQMDFVDYRYEDGKNKFTIGKKVPDFQPQEERI